MPISETSVEFPGLDGFKVNVAYLTRSELQKLRKKATTTKFNRRTHTPEEEVDAEIFQDLYVKAVIKGWSGLKLKYLPKLVPVNLEGVDVEEELEYTHENAMDLMKNSPTFDNFISSTLDDLENFTQSS